MPLFSIPPYMEIIKRKRAQREDALKGVTPSPALDEFTRATATEIVAHIGKGEWTASQVINAYISRAAFAQGTTDCLTEIMFDRARKQAQELDDEFAKTKKLKGPLHGVPTSCKDQFDIAGVDTTLGCTQWAFQPQTLNADLPNQLLEAGAVLFTKTNIPQTLFAFECCNPVWGRTTHPLNNGYTSGGSTGGEAALLSMCGSAIGIGSDVAGSLRIPAAYCGIYCLKPSVGRVSLIGARDPMNPGFQGIEPVVGPIGRTIDDLELVSQLVFGEQYPGPRVVYPMPFQKPELPKKLCFGYYTSDGYVKSSPACQRAVLETVKALTDEGHECIEFEVPGTSGQAFDIFMGLTTADDYTDMFDYLKPDPVEPSLWFISVVPKMSAITRKLVTWMMETLYHDKLFANTIRATKRSSYHDYMSIIAERDAYKISFYQQVWGKYNFDGIIAPVQALPQLPNGGCKYFCALVASTSLYDVLDYPVGCVPVTTVDPTQDQITKEWIEGPGHGSAILEGGLFTSTNPLYKPSEMKGMPVSVQVIGRELEDEKVLGMMRVVDGALAKKGDRGFGPSNWK